MRLPNLRLAPLLVVAVVLPVPAGGAILRVPDDHPGIQTALDAASDGDRIVVSPGTYAEQIDFLGKAVEVVSRDGAGVTLIDATAKGSVVVFRNGEGRDSLLQGFTLQGGSGTLIVNTLYGGGILCFGASPTLRENVIVANTARLGGGIAIVGDAAPRLEANRFMRNGTVHGASMPIAGGAIYCEDSAPELVGNHIEDNQASRSGGGIAATAGATPLLEDNVILANHAGPALTASGGGLTCLEGAMVFARGNLVRRNGAPLGAGAHCGPGATLFAVDNEITENRSSGAGGGVALVGDVGSLLQSNRIVANAASEGAGVYCQGSDAILAENLIRAHRDSIDRGAGIACVGGSTTRIEANRIEENAAAEGAGLYLAEQSEVSVLRNHVLHNNTFGDGAGILARSARATFEGNVIAANVARRGRGAGLFLSLSRSVIASSTIADNEARAPHPETTSGGGIYIHDSTVEVYNSIFWHNRSDEGAQIDRFFGNLSVDFSIVEGGWPGNENLDADPLFVGIATGDLHLRIDSPAVDRGDPTAPVLGSVDIDGEARVIDGDRTGGGRVDIGADEMRPEIAARFGRVSDSARCLTNVLFINGSAGDRERRVVLRVGDPLHLRLVPPPAGPEPAGFAAYAWISEPDPVTISLQPRGLGFMAFPTPLTAEPVNQPARIWNNFGYRRRLGSPDFASHPAPSTPLEMAAGARFPVLVTFQAFIEDAASGAEGPLSITNAVVVEITD